MYRAGFLPFLALACAGLMNARPPAADLAGDWMGKLGSGAEKLRLRLHVIKTYDGLYIGRLFSIDQGDGAIPVGRVTVEGRSVALEVPVVSGSFKGELSPNGSTLAGKWTQGEIQPLTFKRSGPPPAEPPKEANPLSPSDAPVDVVMPERPIPFRGADGQSHLMYELHVTNFSPGRRAVAFLSVSFANDMAPTNLRHRLILAGATLDLAPAAVQAVKPIVIGPPLAGTDWLAMNGPGSRSEHRRALVALGGHVVAPQRFAIDCFQLATAGSMFTGDAKNNKNYRAYGAEVLAVADATVARMKDGIPDNTPGEDSSAVSDADDAELGNYLILDLGDGNYGLYAHLQPGTLRVKAGDKVTRGQALGLLGNSGNSTAPHLHFQVMNGTSLLDPEGVPYLIDSFEVLSGPNAGRKTDALPMDNMRVKFASVVR